MSSFGAAGVQWRQPEGVDNVLEIDLPIVLPAGGRARDLSVTIADKQIIVVKHQDVKIWQVRLAEPVSETVEWHVENENILKLELEKVVPNRWSSLLAHFMAKTDPNFLSLDDLNAILQKELPSLPPIGPTAKKDDDVVVTPEATEEPVAEDGETAEEAKEPTNEEVAAETEEAAADATEEEKADEEKEETKEDGETAEAPATTSPAAAEDSEDDLDKLLDDAADELDGSKPATETKAVVAAVDGEKADAKKDEEEEEATMEQKHHDLIIEAELEAMKQESDAIVSKMEELEEKLKTAEGDELEMVKKHLEVTGRMLALNREARQLRVAPMTVDLFLQTQRIDILKARCNIGDTTNEETEEYADDSEKELSGDELFQAGMQFLESDPETGVHFLRLASIHKDHAVATSILFSIYSNAPASYARGVSLIMRLARIGETADDIVPSANDRAGSLFNAGARHFAPLWAVAVYFHQRGALTGSIQSMLALSNLHRKGVCEGAEGTPDELLNKNNKRGDYFSRQALDRGGIMAYAQLASKELGANNLVEARKHLDRAIAADPEIRKSETIAKLDLIIRMKSRQDEAPVASIASKAPTTVVKAAVDDDEVEEMHPSSRLQPAPTMPSAADRLAQFGGGNAAPAPAAARGGAGGIMGTTKGRGGAGATSGSGAKSKAFWERATTVSIVGGALYFFAFPIRAMMLESYYNLVGGFLAAIGFGDNSAPF